MMTFKEAREKWTNLYPTTIPQELQLTINDWYNDRQICDDEKFPVFFQRLLNQTFPMYQELLRVQPGYAHYDWLVTM